LKLTDYVTFAGHFCFNLTEVKPGEKVAIDAEEAAGGWRAKSIQVSAVKSSE